MHPHAGAIDTPLPSPATVTVTHMMLGSKTDWVEAHKNPGDASFDEYPQESLAEWHRRHGLGS